MENKVDSKMKLTMIETITDDKIKESWAQELPCLEHNGKDDLEASV